VSRLPLVDVDHAGAELRSAFARMPVKLNILRMLAHAENDALPVMRLANAILHRQQLKDRDRELLILQVAELEGGAYEWLQHLPIAESAGVTPAEIEALKSRRFDGAVFDARTRALLAFGRSVIEAVRVEDAVFARMREYFDAREIVEAIVAIGFYMMMSRLTEATATDHDAALGVELYKSGKNRGKK